MHDCEGIGADIGRSILRICFCATAAAQNFIFADMRGQAVQDGEVSKQLGSSRLSFCSDAQLMDKLGLIAGSVTPMALYRESARDVVVAIDEDILI